MDLPAPVIRTMGQQPYLPIWKAMRTWTCERTPETPDQWWVVEHDPVYTTGPRGAPEELLAHRPHTIPVISTDRGGQWTYHGPGQWILYPLLDLRRLGWGIRSLVHHLEQACIDWLAIHGLPATRHPGAPGVYIAGAKIAALGLRVRQGCCYHGLALNIDLDLAPFQGIHPCGRPGAPVTSLAKCGVVITMQEVSQTLLPQMMAPFPYPPMAYSALDTNLAMIENYDHPAIPNATP